MKKSIAFILPAILLFSSCASMLNSKNQRVVIQKQEGQTLVVDGDTAVANKKGKYLIERKYGARQLVFSQEGYKDRYDIQAFKGNSPLKVLSFVPFGILLYPMFYDVFPKAYRYNGYWDYSGVELNKWPTKQEDEKEIYLNNVEIDVDGSDMSYRQFLSYNKYLKKESTTDAEYDDADEGVKISETNLEGLLNEILLEQGYIDTTNKVLKNSYINNLKVNASIDKMSLDYIKRPGMKMYYPAMKYSFVMEWEILDYYDDIVLTVNTESSSGFFSAAYYGFDKAIEMSIKDALENGMIEFLKNSEVQKMMIDRSQKDVEKEFEPIVIKRPKKRVTRLAESTQGSVTIIVKEGHGSGFVISEDGYIVTNYHVVAQNTDSLNVVFNDRSKTIAKVVRSSKLHDLALIKVDTNGLSPFIISDSDAELAQDVYAIGTPTAEDLGQSITKGIVSGIRKGDDGNTLIQTDASVNGGNSGGAILNTQGEVVGIVSSKIKGYGIEGIAFGIPARTLRENLKLEFKY